MDFQVDHGRANIFVSGTELGGEIRLVGVKQYGGFRGAILRFFGYASEIKGLDNTVIFVNRRSLFKKIALGKNSILNVNKLKSKIQTVEAELIKEGIDSDEIDIKNIRRIHDLFEAAIDGWV